MTSLANATQISRNDVPDYLYYMERAGMIGLLRDDTGGVRGLGKVEKVYIDNPNLMYALAEQIPDTGNLRETFFYNQMRVNNEVRASRASDFTIGDHTFEIGGRKKGQKQIEDLPGGIVVKDDIEYGFLNTVPLWAFGLNY
jgi:predicted AAA+ superfamily ATPase